VDDAIRIPGNDITGPIQLTDCYLYDLRVSRGQLDVATEPANPSLDQRVRTWSMADDRLSMIVILAAEVRHQFRPEAAVEIDAAVAGHFASTKPIDSGVAAEFVKASAIVVLWPYLRAYIANTAADLQIELPPLPVIDISALLHRVAAETARSTAAKRRKATAR
jgi:preprotein translocase subunit SecB